MAGGSRKDSNGERKDVESIHINGIAMYTEKRDIKIMTMNTPGLNRRFFALTILLIPFIILCRN
jgi:hypothetical protein